MARERERRRTAMRRGEMRTARRERQEGKKKRRRILYFLGSGIFAVAIIVGLFVPSFPGAGIGTGSGATSYADGIGVPQALMPTVFHVTETVDYSTVPPTSGDHSPITTQCGFYENEVLDEIVVHNMEHGNIVMSYNLTNSADIERLREVHNNLNGNDEWLVTRFYPDIPEGTVALTAWGVLDEFQGVDEDRIERFYEAYKGNLFTEETRGLGRGIPCTSSARMDR